MKYIKLFEDLTNKLDNIIDVFQDIEDEYDVDVQYLNEIEIEIVFDKGFRNLQGIECNKFYGYLVDVEDYRTTRILGDNATWVDEDGENVMDRSKSIDQIPDISQIVDYKSRGLGELSKFDLRENPYYTVTITGHMDYISDNFDGISNHIKNCISKLDEIYGISLRNNKPHHYKNGIYFMPGHQARGSSQFQLMDWMNPKKIYPYRSVEICHLNIYFEWL